MSILRTCTTSHSSRPSVQPSSSTSDFQSFHCEAVVVCAGETHRSRSNQSARARRSSRCMSCERPTETDGSASDFLSSSGTFLGRQRSPHYLGTRSDWFWPSRFEENKTKSVLVRGHQKKAEKSLESGQSQLLYLPARFWLFCDFQSQLVLPEQRRFSRWLRVLESFGVLRESHDEVVQVEWLSSRQKIAVNTGRTQQSRRLQEDSSEKPRSFGKAWSALESRSEVVEDDQLRVTQDLSTSNNCFGELALGERRCRISHS